MERQYSGQVPALHVAGLGLSMSPHNVPRALQECYLSTEPGITPDTAICGLNTKGGKKKHTHTPKQINKEKRIFALILNKWKRVLKYNNFSQTAGRALAFHATDPALVPRHSTWSCKPTKMGPPNQIILIFFKKTSVLKNIFKRI